MKTKHLSFLLSMTLMVTSLACSFLSLPKFRKLETGSTQTFIVNEPYSNTDQVQEVSLSMVIGEFKLSGGADALLEGEVRYNVETWKPMVESSEHSLRITQGDTEFNANGFPGGDIVNDWNVKLGNVPLNLSLEAGGYDATLDLSGLALRQLNVQDGTSDTEVRFDTLNPEQMQSLTYLTGASDITFLGLSNANFMQMNFEGGAGAYMFDFSGDLQRDANVNIRVGVSDIEVLIPTGISAQVFVENGTGEVFAEDSWRRTGDHYENKGNGPQLIIVVEMGAGTLRLTND